MKGWMNTLTPNMHACGYCIDKQCLYNMSISRYKHIKIYNIAYIYINIYEYCLLNKCSSRLSAKVGSRRLGNVISSNGRSNLYHALGKAKSQTKFKSKFAVLKTEMEMAKP